MKNLRRLGAAVVLTFVLGLSVLAGDIPTPPCAPGDIPTPPCAAGKTLTFGAPPVSNAADIYSFAEVALNVLQSVLSLF